MDKIFEDPILDLEDLSEIVESPRFIKKPKDGLSVQKVQENVQVNKPQDDNTSIVDDEFLNSLENNNAKETVSEPENDFQEDQDLAEQERAEQERAEREAEEKRAFEEEERRKQKEAEREKRKEELRRRKEQEISGEADSKTPESSDEEATVLLGKAHNNYPTLTDKETGEIHEIDKRIFTCGKRRNSNLVIQDDFVSRKHAALIKRDNKLYLKDLGSLNGTYIEDFKLPKNLEVELRDNQTIIFANKEFIINL